MNRKFFHGAHREHRGDLLLGDTAFPLPPGEGQGEGNDPWSPLAVPGSSLPPRRANRRATATGGFTLIELLLVLAILGILAAIVVPKFSGRTEQARRTAAESQIATFGTALDSYEVDMGTYPQGKDGLQQLVEEPRDNKNWKGPYLKSDIPKDPWGQPYTYEFPGRHNTKSYDLASVGPDGREGTEDDVANWQTANK